jgi:repressor LexA
MEKVDKRREKMYRYIVERIDDGSPPTVREICRALDIKSTSTVHSDLKAMADEGLLTVAEGLNRAIRLPGRSSVSVPLVGTVAAGVPILAVENIESYIPVASERLSGRELFALHVKGESMINAAILPGDIAVVEKTPAAEDGQIIVALVGEEATVKRYFRESGGRHRLQPENSAFEPLVLDEVEVLGRVVSVIRYLA